MYSGITLRERLLTQGIRSKCINKLVQDYKYLNRTKA